MIQLSTISDLLFGFALYYPLFMAYLWMAGALIYYFHWERKELDTSPLFNSPPPPVTILVPCHNESDNICETLKQLLQQNYPSFEIIAINDASTDNTGDLLDQLARSHEQIRVIHFKENMGKATALNMGAAASKNEFLICIDGDALLDDDATGWIMKHFINGPRVGAVTGNS